jgi:hypothetical protein
MKNRKEENWLKNDNWETPQYIFDFVSNYFEGKDFFDPCPLAIDNGGGWYEIQFDWLCIDWKERNYVNPPYNITDKPKFVKKAFEEFKKWKTSILLIPATTEVQWFHQYIVPYAWIFFIKWRVKFKGFNSKWEYVTNKTWQSGSMICILDPKKEPFMKTLEVVHE